MLMPAWYFLANLRSFCRLFCPFVSRDAVLITVFWYQSVFLHDSYDNVWRHLLCLSWFLIAAIEWSALLSFHAQKTDLLERESIIPFPPRQGSGFIGKDHQGFPERFVRNGCDQPSGLNGKGSRKWPQRLVTASLNFHVGAKTENSRTFNGRELSRTFVKASDAI